MRALMQTVNRFSAFIRAGWRFWLGLGCALASADARAVTTYVSPPWQAATFAGYTGAGSADGAAASATFNEPTGVAIDGAGALYWADSLNSTIR